MKNLYNYRFAFLAGTCAAGGSFFGKLPSYIAARQLLDKTNARYLYFDLITHSLPFVLMLICNVLNWRYFLKALQAAEQTLTATVLTAATNYIVSFILAFVVYNEEVGALSSAGALLIVVGLWFLCDIENSDKKLKSN